MKLYTDKELDDLVKCPKRIVEPPLKQMKQERGSKRNNMTFESKDGEYRFKVFMRQSLAFEEDFSVGLDYFPKEDPGSVCLLRCNDNMEQIGHSPHHAHYHIHRAKAEDINAGIKIERYVEITSVYASYRDGLAYFLRLISLSLEDVDKYFPRLMQKNLFLADSE